MKKTVLIVGISSFVGSNLALAFKDEYRVVGTFFQTPVEIPGVTTIMCNVLKKDSISKLVGIIKPDITIYAVGMSSLTECKLNPKGAEALNTVGAVNVCTAAERQGSKFVLISTGYVLAGTNQLFKEGDIPFAMNTYGANFAATEFYVQRSCLNYLIIRCPLLYGRSYGSKHPNFFESLQTSFAKGTSLKVDDSVMTGFLDVDYLGTYLKLALKAEAINRLFQISSRNFMSRYEFSQKIAKVFKKDENLLQKVSANFPADHGQAAKAEGKFYFQMDTYNIEDFLGIIMPTVEESIQKTFSKLSGKA